MSEAHAEASADLLITAANEAVDRIASDPRRLILVSRHGCASGGLSFGLVVLGSATDGRRAWSVLAAAREGAWGVRAACPLPVGGEEGEPYALDCVWLPYGERSDRGTMVAASRNAEHVRAIRCRTAPADCFAVFPDLLVAVSWDAEQPDANSWLRPRQADLSLDGSHSWLPAAELPRAMVSLESFVAACRRHARTWQPARPGRDADLLAWSDLTSVWDARDKLPLVRILMNEASLEEEPLLGSLGAGPLEDMGSDWLLDELGPGIVADRRWLYALSMVRDFNTPGPLAARFSALLTPEMRDWIHQMELDV
jgi:hypothetical protein